MQLKITIAFTTLLHIDNAEWKFFFPERMLLVAKLIHLADPVMSIFPKMLRPFPLFDKEIKNKSSRENNFIIRRTVGLAE